MDAQKQACQLTPEISLIVPCYNRAYDLNRALEAYDRQVGSPSFEVVAVDDGSSDDTYAILRSFQPRRYSLKVLRQEQNRGPAAARNIGIRSSAAPLVLFVGDDILPDPYLVQGHLAAHRFHSNKEIAVLGKVVWPADIPVNTLMTHIDGVGAQQFSYHYLRDGQVYDFRHFYTANISLKRGLLETQDHWFDTDFPYAAFEDVELSFRLSRAGMKIVYLSHLVGFHYHYHNIWTFSNRQFKSGMMACLAARKQPGASSKLLGRYWKLHLLHLRLLSRLQPPPEGASERLEMEALHLASSFEWTDHLFLNQLYLRLLSYYYYKGMLYGSVQDPPSARRLSDLFAQRALAPLITRARKWNP